MSKSIKSDAEIMPKAITETIAILERAGTIEYFRDGAAMSGKPVEYKDCVEMVLEILRSIKPR